MSAGNARGFTLVEMVVAITIAAIVVGFGATFLATPVQAYFAQTRRAELVDASESAIRWIEEDVRSALPGSIRFAGGVTPTLEVIRVDAIALYRPQGGIGDGLIIGPAGDPSFDVLEALAPPRTPFRVVVKPAVPATSAYAPNVMSAAGGSMTNALNVVLNPVGRFPQPSMHRRAYIVTTAVRYVCNLAAGTLVRYDNMPITPAGLAPVGAAPGSVVARDVSACTFSGTLGDENDGGIATVNLTVSRPVAGGAERLRLFRQITVDNVP